ncbi:disulfide bond formation protein B [Bacillus luteolus]|uniref:Probable disulfide formation protein n=1 Tax=Litchfieldia luteola TaxID=682179 RepID=A0ABR9QEC6_9BACI|nr:disulfide oxidoreductase [Cytobacillus luteolus]MBE4906844.1 disulfide bond formation protein B [Cytobacillus luteolus]MBP1940502.1 disulfide bond formation protein DsbB [Cytobacillus luteolus]
MYINESENKKKENLLFLSFAASLIATLGSLYFSEIQKYIPCELCWYQRIFMYPLVFLLGMALVKKDYAVARYSFVLSTIGGLISLYHYSIQKVPFLAENSISCGIVPCTGQYINWLGFITIPFLALVAFIIISISSFMIMKKRK